MGSSPIRPINNHNELRDCGGPNKGARRCLCMWQLLARLTRAYLRIDRDNGVRRCSAPKPARLAMAVRDTEEQG